MKYMPAGRNISSIGFIGVETPDKARSSEVKKSEKVKKIEIRLGHIYQNLYNFFDNKLSDSILRYITSILCSGRSLYTETTKSFYKKIILASMPVARSIAPCGGSAPRDVLSKALLCTKKMYPLPFESHTVSQDGGCRGHWNTNRW